MDRILELFVHLTTEEKEILLTEYGDLLALKFFISRQVDKAIKNECERITNTEKYIFRNSVPETDEKEIA